MSAGPIAQARRAHVVTFASTTDTARVCMRTSENGRGYCGRTAKAAKLTAEWGEVECADCEAARRADLAAEEREKSSRSRDSKPREAS